MRGSLSRRVHMTLPHHTPTNYRPSNPSYELLRSFRGSIQPLPLAVGIALGLGIVGTAALLTTELETPRQGSVSLRNDTDLRENAAGPASRPSQPQDNLSEENLVRQTPGEDLNVGSVAAGRLWGQNGDQVPPRESWGRGGPTGVFAERSLVIEGVERTYRLAAPWTIRSDRAVPLLFVFHGSLAYNKESMHRLTRLDALARKQQLMIVYPHAKGFYWKQDEATDDLAFFDVLFESLTSQYNVDLNRVYATGFSSGGNFTHWLASKRSKHIAAIAPHSAEASWLASHMDASRKYSVLLIHGTRDQVIPLSQSIQAQARYQQAGHNVTLLQIENLVHYWGHKADVNDQMWEFFRNHPMQ